NNLIIQILSKLPVNITHPVVATVAGEKRFYTSSNHTATHLMQAALKEVLGDHVQQKGSLVNEHYLRFDFSHFSRLTDVEIKQIEVKVNEKIRANIPLDEQRS